MSGRSGGCTSRRRWRGRCFSLVAARADRGSAHARLDGGTSVAYTLRTHPPDAHLLKPTEGRAPTSALGTAMLLNLHLSAGDIEEAALLSNAPRRRYEVLHEYREAVGAEEFKRVSRSFFLRRTGWSPKSRSTGTGCCSGN